MFKSFIGLLLVWLCVKCWQEYHNYKTTPIERLNSLNEHLDSVDQALDAESNVIDKVKAVEAKEAKVKKKLNLNVNNKE